MNTPVNGLVISWNSSTNAAGYEYCLDTTNDNLCSTGWDNAGAALAATVNNLDYETKYYWQVRALNADVTLEANSGTWFEFTTTFPPPQNFSKVSPANWAAEQSLAVTLRWEASAGQAVAYEYCYDTTGGSTCQNSLNWEAAGGDTTATISGLAYQTTYSWQARARNASGTIVANQGNYWHFTTLNAPPAGFHKISPGIDVDDQPLNPTIDWDASHGQNVTYEYCFTSTPDAVACDGIWYQAGSDTQAALSGLRYNTLYFWQVRAMNTTATTYADDGALWRFRTQVAPPSPFSKLTPSHLAADQPAGVRLSWSPSENAATYFYCVDETDNGECDTELWIDTEGQTSAAPVGLAAGLHTYYWQVYAHNAKGDSYANSDTWWSFTTLNDDPADFTKLSPLPDADDQQLTTWLYWSASEDAESYQYCISATQSCPTDQDWVSTGANLFVQVPQSANLQHDTPYYWQVRAVNASGETEANSAWWPFTTMKAGPAVTNQRFEDAVEDETYYNTLTAQSNYGKIFSLAGSPPPGNVVLGGNGSFSYTPPADFQGTVSFHFIVSDGYNLPSDSYEATIVVQGRNDSPELAFIPDQQVKTGEPVQFTVTASDADIPYGDQITLSIEGLLPAGATFSSNTGLYNWMSYWSPSHPGAYTYIVKAEDNSHASDSQQLTVSVEPSRVMVPITLYLP